MMTKLRFQQVIMYSYVLVLVSIILLLISHAAFADEVKYTYDDLGRLYQVVDSQGNVATYNYDAVGNLLSRWKDGVSP